MKRKTSFSQYKLKVHARVPGYLGQYEEEVETEKDEDTDESFDTEEEEWNNFGADGEETGRSSFACEDCDHRWEDYYNVEAMSDVPSCPMCGSGTVVEL